MKRTLDYLVKRVREELRAEGPDGAGYTDFIIIDALNTALDDLSGIYTIRDAVEITTVAGQQTYDLEELLSGELYKVLRVAYDGNQMQGVSLDDFMNVNIPDDGPVRQWFLWGHQLTLVGAVEEKPMKLWIMRGPNFLEKGADEPETPRHADEALVAYAVSVCYRESRDYERANYHYRLYQNQKNELLRRAVPQDQRDSNPVMNDSYWEPFNTRRFGGYPRKIGSD